MQIVVLTVVQGITEFLPISSSGHLLLVPVVTGWPDQGLDLDAAVHIGTLAAVLVYFWRDVLAMATSPFSRKGAERTVARRLFWFLIVGTIPALIAGGLLHTFSPDFFRSAKIVAWTTLGYAALLFLADRFSPTVRRIEYIKLPGALVIGLAQMLALVPGTSRSGITMTAGRLLGLERTEAARYAMLLSIPATASAGALALKDVLSAEGPEGAARMADTGIAIGMTFVVALFAVWFLMSLLRRYTFTPFVIYRVLLGLALVVWLYGYN
ncbi:MAG: undecaprenyl-diphosphate phosphatase [Alphaproteobacteria bacterium]|nr:undecaprenyl-diphosphate phosphatase [Alphaproteobacteria bacterium]